jgi:hypothetical protein
MMSWIRSSETAVALCCLALLVGAAGTAAAISLSTSDAPNDARVGEEVNATMTVEDPFTDAPSEWTLRGETELRNVSWTVTVYDQGQQVSQETYGGQSFEQGLARSAGGDEVRIELRGETPRVNNFSYDPEETFVFAELTQQTGNNTQALGESVIVHHYTNKSQSAREEIERANDAIEQAGGNQQAQRSLQQAISAYNNGNFNNAISNAQDAKRAANQAQQSQQTTTLLLYGAVGVVALLIVIGGVWYYRQQQDDYDKLR